MVPVPARRLHALRIVWPRRERVVRHREHDWQPHGVVDGFRRAFEHVVQLLALISQRDSFAPALDAEELLELGCRELHHVEQGDLAAAPDEVAEAYRSEKALRSLGRARRLVDHHGSTRGMLQRRHRHRHWHRHAFCVDVHLLSVHLREEFNQRQIDLDNCTCFARAGLERGHIAAVLSPSPAAIFERIFEKNP